jgi:hypothetical protein
MKMHAHCLTLFFRAGQFEGQCDAVSIQVSVKARGVAERANVELVRIFHRDFGSVGNRFHHDAHPLKIRENNNRRWLTIA